MAESDPRDLRIAELEQQLALAMKALERMAELEQKLAAATARITAADARIAELERQLARNSGNSSQPPSADPPHVSRKSKQPSGRKPGGQPGRIKRTRELVPAARVDEFVDLSPDICDGCGGGLQGHDADPDRHQVTELPPVRPHVTEYRLHALRCRGCGHCTRAQLPIDAHGAFGPRLMAFVAMLTAKFHLSKRGVPELMKDAFDLDISLGAISDIEHKLSTALIVPVDEAFAHVRDAPVANADETSWPEAHELAWLWTAITPSVTVFRIDTERGAEAARRLLGADFTGLLGSDRWCGYDWISLTRRQLCWAHLKRDFQEIAEAAEPAISALGDALLHEHRGLFHDWHRARDGEIADRLLATYVARRKRAVRELLERGRESGHKRTAGTCRHILRRWPALWTFVDDGGIEPTNNVAERAIRPAVLWRKGCFGTHAPRGSRFVERALTVIATLKQQGRNLLEFLTAAAHAMLTGSRPPSLLPGA